MSDFLISLAVVILILMAAIPVILLIMTGGLKSQIAQMQHELKKIAKAMENNPAQDHTPRAEKSGTAAYMLPVEKETGMTHTIETVGERPEEKQPGTRREEMQPVFVPLEEPAPVEETHPLATEPVVEPVRVKEPKKTGPARPPQKSFNFEKFIGENLINKIGIVVLVIGIGLFVKYAIENNWINETGRVVIGFLSGGVLLALAYKFHKSYRAFSSVLAGGAITVFYFTVAIAFREYELFGQVVSFVLMVLVTSLSVCLSILYNRRELAILSMIGGFLTPFMVSTGSGNYHVLFTYIAVLNVGMLALSLSKQWKELLIIDFVGTQLIFWIYYIANIHAEYDNNAQNLALLIYASVFYLIFLMMPLIHVFRAREPHQDYFLNDFLLSANSFVYLLAGILLMNRIGAEHIKGLLSGMLAAVNGMAALAVYRKKKGENLCHLFTGLSVCFLALTAPLQLDGNYVTLFWATEAILLLWLFGKSNRAVFYYGSLLLLLCSFTNLMIDHANQSCLPEYDLANSVIFRNQFFITRLYVSLSFLLGGILLRRYCTAHPVRTWALPRWLPTAFCTVSVCLLYYTGYREIGIYADADRITHFHWRMAYTAFFLFAVALITGRRPETCRFKVYALLTLWVFGCIYYWLFAEDVRWVRYDLRFSITHVLLYWAGFAALCGLFAATAKCFYKRNSFKSGSGKTFTWFFTIVSVICLSVALSELFAQIGIFRDISMDRYHKAGITILWTMCAFAQMWLGMRFRYKTLRIISLILFALVLVKLFLFDLRHVSQGAKIVAFVVLGVVLLILSFLYQKLKRILFEDDDLSVAGTDANTGEQ